MSNSLNSPKHSNASNMSDYNQSGLAFDGSQIERRSIRCFTTLLINSFAPSQTDLNNTQIQKKEV